MKEEQSLSARSDESAPLMIINMSNQVPIDSVLYLRMTAMYPDKGLDFVRLEEDGIGLHFGLYIEQADLQCANQLHPAADLQELVSVVSLFLGNDTSQFRKFCTLPRFQRKGFGTRLLKYVFEWIQRQENMHLIWCNARSDAAPFYQRLGMAVSNPPVTFQKNGFSYVKMEKAICS